MEGQVERAQMQRRHAPSRVKRFFDRFSRREFENSLVTPGTRVVSNTEDAPLAVKSEDKNARVTNAGLIIPSAPPFHHLEQLPPEKPTPLPTPGTSANPGSLPFRSGIQQPTTVMFQPVQPAHRYPAPQMAYIVQQQQAIPQHLHLGQNPCSVVCPKCKNSVVSIVSYSCGLFTWLIGAAIFICGGCLGCCLIPCCMNSFKDCTHTCPRCGYKIGEWRRIQGTRGSTGAEYA